MKQPSHTHTHTYTQTYIEINIPGKQCETVPQGIMLMLTHLFTEGICTQRRTTTLSQGNSSVATKGVSQGPYKGE